MVPRPIDSVAELETALTWMRQEESLLGGRIVSLVLVNGSFELTPSILQLLTFSSADPSEIILQGSGGTIVRSASPTSRRRAQSTGLSGAMINVLAGAPPIIVRGLIFEASDDAPAIGIAGSMRIENCVFARNRGAAVIIHFGARATIQSSQFTDNGGTGRTSGGAVVAQGGHLDIADSHFTNNVALSGGALHVDGSATVIVSNSMFQRNRATAQGGALSIAGNGRVVLGDGTQFAQNNAPSGRSVFRGEDARATYTLPAKLGYWISNAQTAQSSTNCRDLESSVNAGADPARHLMCPPNKTSTWLLNGPLNDDFPFICPPGTVGDSMAVAAQSSPQCRSACPAGYFCVEGTVLPEVCTIGHYCGPGSPAPTACPPGTYGDQIGLVSSRECIPCEPGFWCRSGARNPCEAGFYNSFPGASNTEACTRCPEQATTLELGSTSQDNCLCERGFFDGRNPYEAGNSEVNNSTGAGGTNITMAPSTKRKLIECFLCTSGTDCSSTSGITLLTLPVLPGYWRPSAVSLDIRLCADADKNCTDSTVCPDKTSSGCAGGNSFNDTCHAGLTGPFCQLCAQNTTGAISNYIGAEIGSTADAVAHCELCDTGSLLQSIAAGAVFAIVSLISIIIAARCALKSACVSRIWNTIGGLIRATNLINKLKISVGFYMLVSKMQGVYKIIFPPFVAAILNWIDNLLSFGIDGFSTPLVCVGLGGFRSKLLFFVMLFPMVMSILWTGLLLQMAFQKTLTRITYAEKAINVFVRLLFLFYPVISTIAFKAFACHNFPGSGSWLIADVNIACGTDEHYEVMAIAVAAVVVYPVGAIILCTVLLLAARKAINPPKDEADVPFQWLARGLEFLHREFKPEFFWWEIAEMTRRFLLVGLAVILQPGSVFQIIFGTMISFTYMFLQRSCSPYSDPDDDFIASTSSFLLVLCFVCCNYLKYNALLDVQGQAGMLSPDQRYLFLLNSNLLGYAMVLIILGSILLCLVVFTFASRSESARLKRLELAMANRVLRYMKSGNAVDTTMKDPNLVYHLFLSHVWSTGQDQMRIVKQRLKELCPNLTIFLDVDDLKDIGDLEGYVDRTYTVLIFCTNGYFFSLNCMRELLSTIQKGKPVIALLEPELSKGGLTKEVVMEHLASCESKYEKWGLAEQIEGYGWKRPITKFLYDKLFESDAIEWNRIGAFQDVTLRLIAERLLPRPLPDETFIAGAMQTSGVFSLPPTPKDKDFHVFCSAHNVGAARLLQEVAQDKQLEGMQVTQQPELLEKCGAILIYLTSRTWQSGDTTLAFAQEVEKAMDLGVKVLLAHEMPGAGQELRDAIEFKYFFCCEDGTTPTELLKRSIYSTIAVALKGGEWRKVSMVDLAQGLGAVRVEGALGLSMKVMQNASKTAFENTEQGQRFGNRVMKRLTRRNRPSKEAAPSDDGTTDPFTLMARDDKELELTLDVAKAGKTKEQFVEEQMATSAIASEEIIDVLLSDSLELSDGGSPQGDYPNSPTMSTSRHRVVEQEIVFEDDGNAIGVALTDWAGEVVVWEVAEGSAAETKGVRVNAMLRSVNGELVRALGAEAAKAFIASVGRPVRLTIAYPEARPDSPTIMVASRHRVVEQEIVFEDDGNAIGVALTDWAGEVVVWEVAEGSAAETKGVRVNAMLRSVNGELVRALGAEAAKAFIASVGRPVRLTIAYPEVCL